MDDLKPLAVFAETISAGSMSAAARRLGISASAVSQIIRTLELKGGVTLLHRSTRKLALTEAGERYYPHCKRVLEAAQAAAESLQQARDAPTGELRVSSPVGFATHIAPALAPLLSEAPQLRLRLLVDDAMIDLIDARIDLAVRAGRLAGSSWVARRLCDLRMVLCASRDYLDRYGEPSTPDELPAHQWLAFDRDFRVDASGDWSVPPEGVAIDKASLARSRAVSMPITLRAEHDGRRQRIDVNARIASNSQIALRHMCEHGLSIALLVRADVLSSLQRGLLVHVLPRWELAAMPVWAVTPRRDEQAAKVRRALHYLKRYFGTLPGSGV